MTQTDYTVLWAAIGNEMGRRAQHHEPLRVNIWDGNHFEGTPREIAIHPELRAVIGAFGRPVYAVELTNDADAVNGLFEKFAHGDEQTRQKVEAIVHRATQHKPDVRMLMDTLLQAVREGAEVYFPDPRKRPDFSRQEAEMYKRFKGQIERLGGACLGTLPEPFRASLSPQERPVYDAMQEKFEASARGDQIDEGKMVPLNDAIANRIKRRFVNQAEPGGDILVSVYGAGHFSNDKGLNRRLPGVDVAVFNNPFAAKAFFAATSSDQYPRFIWYTSDARLVDMKMPEGKKELDAIAVPDDATVKAACAKALAYLTPYAPPTDVAPESMRQAPFAGMKPQSQPAR